MRTARSALIGCAAAAGFALLASSGVPLYDGIGFPDQPYRYFQPTAGQPRTPPPTAAGGQLTITGGVNPSGQTFATGEVGPQIVLYVPPKALSMGGLQSSGTIDVRLYPTALVGAPTDGVVDSNLYRVELTAGGAAVTAPNPSDAPNLSLREAVAGLPQPVLHYRPTPGATWQRLATSQQGQDIFGAAFVGPGDYLLVRPSAAVKAVDHTRLYAGLALAVLLVILVLAGVRLRSYYREP